MDQYLIALILLWIASFVCFRIIEDMSRRPYIGWHRSFQNIPVIYGLILCLSRPYAIFNWFFKSLRFKQRIQILSASSFVGNRESFKFHRNECKYAQMMSARDPKKIGFETAKEAAKKGYAPCNWCNPA